MTFGTGLRIIILILCLILSFLVGRDIRYKNEVANERVNYEIKINCEGGICKPPDK